MAVNPFTGDLPVDRIDEWIGDQSEDSVLFELKASVKHRANTYILGPEGSGKTSLLKVVFSAAYRKQMARTKKKLIYFADMSGRKDGNDLCQYLAERLKDSLGSLISDGNLLDEIRQLMEDSLKKTGKDRLQGMIETLADEGYFTVIVMDYFEQFTLSPQVTQDHHDCLRSLIESGHLQCIVAINYDLTQDSLPKNIRGSYFLQKFTNAVKMPSFGSEEIRLFMEQKQEDYSWKLPENMYEQILRQSGGIPRFVNILAKNLYDKCCQKNEPAEKDAIQEALRNSYEQAEAIMNGWCELLTDCQLKVIKLLAEACMNNKEYGFYDFTGSSLHEQTAVAALKNRGLLKEYIYEDANGHEISTDYLVRFNSLLFQRYCRENRPEHAMKRNPLDSEGNLMKRSADSMLDQFDRFRFLKDISDNPEIHIHVEGDLVTAGGTKQEGDQLAAGASKTNIEKVENMQVVQQGITVKEFFSLLNGSSDQMEFGQQLGNRLYQQIQERLDKTGLQQALAIERADGDDETVYAGVDQAFYEAGQQIIQDVEVDENGRITDVTTDELQTLETRFKAARDRIHANLTDQFLVNQSERCRFYMKIAVIVEDALNLPSVDFGDYSAQLILYGKAFEQGLRDNLFEAFQGITDLANYQLGQSPNDKFASMDKQKAMIGSFTRLIGKRKGRLADLCSEMNCTCYTGTITDDWYSWWRDLNDDIHKARKIRNRAGHADAENAPNIQDIHDMYDAIVGTETSEGIMERILIGRDMSTHYVN